MSVIGIIGAMDEEISVLKSKMILSETRQTVGNNYYVGSLLGQDIVLVRSGIGKVNASVCTQALINLFGVEYIINIGVAGGLSKKLNIGDIVISSDAVHHDFDSVIFGNPIGVIPFMETSFFEADSRLISIAKETAETILKDNGAFIGRIASGDQFIADTKLKNKITENFGALCVEMEGAAIAHTSWLNNIPFVIIRAISDNADNSAHDSFETFLVSAAHNTARIAEGIVEKI